MLTFEHPTFSIPKFQIFKCQLWKVLSKKTIQNVEYHFKSLKFLKNEIKIYNLNFSCFFWLCCNWFLLRRISIVACSLRAQRKKYLVLNCTPFCLESFVLCLLCARRILLTLSYVFSLRKISIVPFFARAAQRIFCCNPFCLEIFPLYSFFARAARRICTLLYRFLLRKRLCTKNCGGEGYKITTITLDFCWSSPGGLRERISSSTKKGYKKKLFQQTGVQCPIK